MTTMTLDLFGETREVELDLRPMSWSTGDVTHLDGFVGTIGAGAARYPTSLTLWRVTDDKPAYRGNQVATADDGSVWQFNLGCVIRNRNNARIVGWADTAGVTNTRRVRPVTAAENRARVADLLHRLHPDRDTFTPDELYEAYDILWPAHAVTGLDGVRAIVAVPPAAPAPPQAGTVRADVLAYLRATGPRSVPEIVARVAANEATVRSVLTKMKRRGEVTHPARGRYAAA